MINLFGQTDREKGQFPLSIATSLALEGAFDILETGPKYPTPPIHNYDELWVNLRTLYRNIRGAMEREVAEKITHQEMYVQMIAELSALEGIIAQRTSGTMKIVFYACDYNNLTRLYPKALFKPIRTDKQAINASIENNVLAEVFKNEANRDFTLYHFDTRLTLMEARKKPRVLIITHYPFDLLSRDEFATMDLLESHTGAIKKPPQWNTKLHNGKELERIPFNKMTIQLFGDSAGLLSPYPIAYRREMIEIANKYKWNSSVSKDRILLCVKMHHNASLQMLVSELYR